MKVTSFGMYREGELFIYTFQDGERKVEWASKKELGLGERIIVNTRLAAQLSEEQANDANQP